MVESTRIRVNLTLKRIQMYPESTFNSVTEVDGQESDSIGPNPTESDTQPNLPESSPTDPGKCKNTSGGWLHQLKKRGLANVLTHIDLSTFCRALFKVFDWIDADGDKELNYTEMVAYLWDQKGFKGQKGLRAGGGY